jgi:hypothetical protein
MEMALSLSRFKKDRLKVANQHAPVGYEVTIPLGGWPLPTRADRSGNYP